MNVVARCQILRLNCTKFDVAYSAPQAPAGFKGPTSKGRQGRGGEGRLGREEGTCSKVFGG